MCVVETLLMIVIVLIAGGVAALPFVYLARREVVVLRVRPLAASATPRRAFSIRLVHTLRGSPFTATILRVASVPVCGARSAVEQAGSSASCRSSSSSSASPWPPVARRSTRSSTQPTSGRKAAPGRVARRHAGVRAGRRSFDEALREPRRIGRRRCDR